MWIIIGLLTFAFFLWFFKCYESAVIIANALSEEHGDD